MNNDPTQYMTRRRARFQSLTGFVNLPYGTYFDVKEIPISENGPTERYLFYNGRIITSEACDIVKAYLISVDGEEEIRGKLIDELFKILKCDPIEPRNIRTPDNQAKWTIVWNTPIFEQYRSKQHDDFWIWDIKLFQASKSNLEQLVKYLK